MEHRLNQPIRVLAFKDNHQLAVTVRAGRIVEIVGPVENDDCFIVPSMNDEQFHAFTSDLVGGAECLLAHETAGPSLGGGLRTTYLKMTTVSTDDVKTAREGSGI